MRLRKSESLQRDLYAFYCCLCRQISAAQRSVSETAILLSEQRVSQDAQTEVIITTTFPTSATVKRSKGVGVL